MSYDEKLARRIREILGMVRVGAEAYEDALARAVDFVETLPPK